MANFTPLSSFAGGILIGVSAVLLLWLNGRIAGISGIAGGLLSGPTSDRAWRFLFLAGLVGGVALYRLLGGPLQQIEVTPSLPLLIGGGLLVGLGTRVSGGCTSGHGVCGLGRRSPRSLAATATFMAVAGVTVFVVRHVLGGS